MDKISIKILYSDKMFYNFFVKACLTLYILISLTLTFFKFSSFLFDKIGQKMLITF